MEKKYVCDNFRHMLHGADYNGDQWQDCPDILAEDMHLMKLAGCNVMSVGIFSWATLEPEEGRYDFSYLDKTLDDIYAAGGRVLLATPSGARPAWLSQKYPEVLRVNQDHSKNTHGHRHNHCYTSPVYREKVAQINRRLAERYGNHPAVLMWHISNEYNGKCYCPQCTQAFREWLKEKYKTLDALNHQWWTAFWSHTYTDWEQIDPPSPLGEMTTHGLNLDWKRFCAHQTNEFMKMEIRAVREFAPHIPVTSNFMAFHQDVDYQLMAKEVDVISYDAYPRWRGDGSDLKVASDVAIAYDLNRSLLHKPFMLMESTPSHVNWNPYNKLKRPGQHMLSSMQAIAHGSDTVQYFQWRKSRGSSEKFHGAVVDHVGHEHTRVFREVSQVGARLSKLDAVVGTKTVSRAAILFSWDNRWALQDAEGFQKQDKKYDATRDRLYYSLWKRGINTDVIGVEDDFARYDLLIAPMLYMVDEALETKLREYVARGGTLLCTYTTGMVNENDLVHLGGYPVGSLKEVFGIWNEEIDTLYPDEFNTVAWADGSYKAVDYCEIIHPRGAEVLATYTSDFYAGGAALTRNRYGKGKAYYVAFRDEGDFTDKLIEELLTVTGITSDFDGPLPEGLTAHSRTDGKTLFVFLQNFNRQPVSTETQERWITADTGEAVEGEILLQPYETRILSRKLSLQD